MLAPQRGLIATVKSKSNYNSRNLTNNRLLQDEKQMRVEYSRNSQSLTASPAEPGELPLRIRRTSWSPLLKLRKAPIWQRSCLRLLRTKTIMIVTAGPGTPFAYPGNDDMTRKESALSGFDSQIVEPGLIFKPMMGSLAQPLREKLRPLRHRNGQLFQSATATDAQYAQQTQFSDNLWADAPARVYCVVEDVFSAAKISVAARKQDIKVEFVTGDRDLLAELADMPEAARPSLIVVDLNNTSAKPLTLIPHLRAKLKKSASIIGFVSCLQGDLKVRGVKAGCDAVVSRPAFSRNLSKFLRRYGFEEGTGFCRHNASPSDGSRGS